VVWIDFLCRWIGHHVHAGRSEQLRREGLSDPVGDLVGNRGSSGLVSTDLPRPGRRKPFRYGGIFQRHSLDSYRKEIIRQR
jgi:hypothetical protein